VEESHFMTHGTTYSWRKFILGIYWPSFALHLFVYIAETVARGNITNVR